MQLDQDKEVLRKEILKLKKVEKQSCLHIITKLLKFRKLLIF